MLIEQIVEFKLRGHGLLIVHVFLQLVFFIKKNLSGKSSTGVLFTAKILQEAMYFTFPTWAKQLIKSNLKEQDFKCVLDLNCKYKED